MSKWRTIGVSIPVDSEITGGKEFMELTKKYFKMVMESKQSALIKAITSDKDFKKWNGVLP